MSLSDRRPTQLQQLIQIKKHFLIFVEVHPIFLYQLRYKISNNTAVKPYKVDYFGRS